MAPELLALSDDEYGPPPKDLFTYGLEVDVWSAGVIFAQLLFEYEEYHVTDRLPDATGEAFRQRCWRVMQRGKSYAAHELAYRMLDPSPRTRITLTDALRHEYFHPSTTMPPDRLRNNEERRNSRKRRRERRERKEKEERKRKKEEEQRERERKRMREREREKKQIRRGKNNPDRHVSDDGSDSSLEKIEQFFASW